MDTKLTAVSDQSSLATPASIPMNEIQVRMAQERPRSEEAIMTRLVKELVSNSTYADQGFYSIPYKDNRKGVINFVEGLSIRSAEHMWTRWGNCVVASRIADDRGDKVTVQGMFFDYETGLLNLSDMEVSKKGKKRSGETWYLSEKELSQSIAAAQSKVKRNAFIGGIPVWIKDVYIETCKKLIVGDNKKPIADRIKDAELFLTSKFNVSDSAVKSFIGKVKEAYRGISDIELLRYIVGISNAIKDGNVDVDFIFGEERKPYQMPQPKPAVALLKVDAPVDELNDAIEPA